MNVDGDQYSELCQISYVGGTFVCESREGANAAIYSMENHPVVEVSWYGSAAFCNWLSEREGLDAAYTTGYDLIDADPGTPGMQFRKGYRLPTEAEWERAAAWQSAHWIFGYMSDTITGRTRCNYDTLQGGRPKQYVNPLGLVKAPFTSPVGWFDGLHSSPVDGLGSFPSPSPVGCYDMSGNVWEWCNDWHEYYSEERVTDPIGPPTGAERVIRGGSWYRTAYFCRTAKREDTTPSHPDMDYGFRLAKSP